LGLTVRLLLYIVEYIVVFWLNNSLVSTTTQQDGCYNMIWYI